jgi:hypothetical protein
MYPFEAFCILLNSGLLEHSYTKIVIFMYWRRYSATPRRTFLFMYPIEWFLVTKTV